MCNRDTSPNAYLSTNREKVILFYRHEIALLLEQRQTRPSVKFAKLFVFNLDHPWPDRKIKRLQHPQTVAFASGNNA